MSGAVVFMRLIPFAGARVERDFPGHLLKQSARGIGRDLRAYYLEGGVYVAGRRSRQPFAPKAQHLAIAGIGRHFHRKTANWRWHPDFAAERRLPRR